MGLTIDQAATAHKNPPASAFHMLWIKVYATTPQKAFSMILRPVFLNLKHLFTPLESKEFLSLCQPLLPDTTEAYPIPILCPSNMGVQGKPICCRGVGRGIILLLVVYEGGKKKKKNTVATPLWFKIRQCWMKIISAPGKNNHYCQGHFWLENKGRLSHRC